MKVKVTDTLVSSEERFHWWRRKLNYQVGGKRRQVTYYLWACTPTVEPNIIAATVVAKERERETQKVKNLVASLPINLEQTVLIPVPIANGIVSVTTTSLIDAIITWNDKYKLSREEIARWLDDLADQGIINIDLE